MRFVSAILDESGCLRVKFCDNKKDIFVLFNGSKLNSFFVNYRNEPLSYRKRDNKWGSFPSEYTRLKEESFSIDGVEIIPQELEQLADKYIYYAENIAKMIEE